MDNFIFHKVDLKDKAALDDVFKNTVLNML